MFNGSENCARTPPAAREVEPLASSARSSSSTSTPASARWNAALHPITPPPTITTEADSGSGAVGRGIGQSMIADRFTRTRSMRLEWTASTLIA